MKKILISILLMIPLIQIIPLASASTTVDYSSNWTGYVAISSSPFTSVSANWTVPTVTSSLAPAFSSIWTGIGGFYPNGHKLIQAGTKQDVSTIGYFAWYEIFPQAPVKIGPVKPGDSITVSIHKSGDPSTFEITMTKNNTSFFDKTVNVKFSLASESAAEFIVERPLLVADHQTSTLADFGTVTLSNLNTNQGYLNSLNAISVLTMTSDGTSTGTVLATPSALASNTFSVHSTR